MPPVKELHFFDGARPGLRKAKRLQGRIDKDLDKVNRMRAEDASQPLGERDLRFMEGYLQLFKNKPLMKDKPAATEHYARLFDEKGERKTGDVTPAYSKLDDDDVEAIVRRFPDVKVVFIAREPVERAWSALGMAARQATSRIKQPVTPAMVLKFLNRKDVAGRSYPSRTVARLEEDRAGGTVRVLLLRRPAHRAGEPPGACPPLPRCRSGAAQRRPRSRLQPQEQVGEAAT